jgi:hypothetical protein
MMEKKMEKLDPSHLHNQVESKTVKPGYYSGVPNRLYHLMGGLSSTVLRKGLVSLAHIPVYKAEPFDPVAGVGSTAHGLILEADNFNKEFALKLDGKTKEGKEQKAEALRSGMQLVQPAVMKSAEQIALSAAQHPLMKEVLNNTVKETSGFALYEGEVFKIRPDAMNQEKGYIVDVKTISSGMNEFQVSKLAEKHGWFTQASFYHWVNEMITGQSYKIYHAYIEATAPYGIRIREISHAVIERCLEFEIKPFLPKYLEALKTDKWPGFELEVKDAFVPGYLWSEDDFGNKKEK